MALVLAITSVIAFTPAIAWTQEAKAADTDLYVGGAAVTHSGAVANSNITSGTVNYDADTRTLTLNNAIITGSTSEPEAAECAAIYSGSHLNIVLNGASRVTGADNTSTSYGAAGIKIAKGTGDTGILSISGDGSLMSNAGTAADTSSAEKMGSVGIYCAGPIIVSDSAVIQGFGNTNSAVGSFGIRTLADIAVSGSVQFSGTGGTSANATVIGISAANGITATGNSRITAAGGDANNGYGLSVASGKTISANGDSLVIRGRESAFYQSGSSYQTAVTLGEGETAITNTLYDNSGTEATYTSGTAVVSTVKYFEANPITYGLYVAGKSVNAKNKNDVLGDGTVSYDSSKNALTLKNANITSSAGISYSGTSDFGVVLEGNNSIDNVSSNGTGIYMGNAATSIGGTGSLTITTAGNGITAKNLTVNSGTVHTSGYVGISAISAPGFGLTMNGGTVTAIGTAGPGVNASSLTANGGSLTASGIIGIQPADTIEISGGTVSASGATAPGLIARSITITKGSLTVSSESSVGISESGMMTVNGGKLAVTKSGNGAPGIIGFLTVNAGNVDISGVGIGVASGTVKLNGGTTIIDSTSHALIQEPDITAYNNPYIYAGDSSSGRKLITAADLTNHYSDKYLKIQPNAEQTVPIAPVITTQPVNGSYDINGTVTPLSVSTTDTGAKFQWQQSTDGTSWTNIDGATDPNYKPSVDASGTTKYRCVITGSNGTATYSDAVSITVSTKYAIPAKGKVKTVKGLKYKVVTAPSAAKSTKSSGTVGTVNLVQETSMHKTADIPSYITINTYKFYVTNVSAKAFKNNTKLKSLTLGKNVKTVGAKACYNCQKLKSVKFAGKNITAISKGAFRTCAKNCRFMIPKAKYSQYVKMLKKSGVPEGAQYIKY